MPSGSRPGSRGRTSRRRSRPPSRSCTRATRARRREVMNRAKIVGTGAAVPKKLLTNADLEKLVDTSDTWIRERTGIRERHIVSEGEKFSDLCTTASAEALKRAKMK